MHIWELKIVKAKIKIWKSVKGLTRKMEETAKESVRMNDLIWKTERKQIEKSEQNLWDIWDYNNSQKRQEKNQSNLILNVGRGNI